MGGGEKHPTSTAPSSLGACSLTSWRLRELGWVVGVLAHGGRTLVREGHSHASPQCQSAHMLWTGSQHHAPRGPESWQAQ